MLCLSESKNSLGIQSENSACLTQDNQRKIDKNCSFTNYSGAK